MKKHVSAIALSLLVAGCSATPYTGETISETTTPQGLNVIQTSIRAKAPGAKLVGEDSELQQLAATVEGVNTKTHTLKLKTADNRTVELKVDPQTGTLKKVKAGDKLVLDYYEAVDFEVRKPTADELAVSGLDVDVAAVADKTEKPAAVLATSRVDVLTIESIDKQKELLTLRSGEGYVTVKAKYPQNLKVLKVGDTVVVKTSELFAARIKQVG
jgi:hypothetical protein